MASSAFSGDSGFFGDGERGGRLGVITSTAGGRCGGSGGRDIAASGTLGISGVVASAIAPAGLLFSAFAFGGPRPHTAPPLS